MCAIGETTLKEVSELYEKAELLKLLLLHEEQVRQAFHSRTKVDDGVHEKLDRLYARGLELCNLPTAEEFSQSLKVVAGGRS